MDQPVDVLEWAKTHLSTVRGLLADYDAPRIRGTSVAVDSFGQTVALVVGAPLLEYLNRSTPRSRVRGQVFTSTEYRSDQVIQLHSEQSYATAWPVVLGFWCTTPATSGGRTPLASADDIGAVVTVRATPGGAWGCFETGPRRGWFLAPRGDAEVAVDRLDRLLKYRLYPNIEWTTPC